MGTRGRQEVASEGYGRVALEWNTDCPHEMTVAYREEGLYNQCHTDRVAGLALELEVCLDRHLEQQGGDAIYLLLGPERPESD